MKYLIGPVLQIAKLRHSEVFMGQISTETSFGNCFQRKEKPFSLTKFHIFVIEYIYPSQC